VADTVELLEEYCAYGVTRSVGFDLGGCLFAEVLQDRSVGDSLFRFVEDLLAFVGPIEETASFHNRQ
jgi:hypothetical protein